MSIIPKSKGQAVEIVAGSRRMPNTGSASMATSWWRKGHREDPAIGEKVRFEAACAAAHRNRRPRATA